MMRAELLATVEEALAKAEASECPAWIGELERLKALAWAKLAMPNTGISPPRPPDPAERMLTVAEVAQRFAVTERWLYRHKNRMPHSQPTRKTLLFPEEKLARWFAARKTG